MVGKAKVYKPSPLGVHVKQCVHEEMTLKDGKILYEKFLFTPANYPCGGCNSPDDVVFMRCPPINVVQRSCTYCGVTQPISPRDENDLVRAQQFDAETHEMSVDEMREFVSRNQILSKFVNPVIARMLETKRERRQVNVDNLGLEEETK